MWIGNTDAKDDNSRIYMKKEFGELTAYQESHSELGLSFGGLFNAGQTQKFRPGASFLKRTLFGRKLRFSFPIMFKPEAWKFATYSDMRWMAKKIA